MKMILAEARRAPGNSLDLVALAPTLIGGFALLMIWFKVRSLFGLLDVEGLEFKWGPFVTLMVLAAILALSSSYLFSLLAASLARRLGGRGSSGELRAVWGAAAFPSIAIPLLIFPLDLLAVGTAAYTGDWEGTFETAWAAISCALAISLAIYCSFLLFRGVSESTGLGRARSLETAFSAVVVLGIVVGLLLFALTTIEGFA
ncbi:MAG: hypothetical protein M3280_10020 [Actinomycetota bacterium]|nr:hypothetical protein [Actinomycetota bacterium]